jgi:hypothetical protein
MTIPHLPPIKFAQKIVRVNNNEALVLVSFPFEPTLAMYVEAAAQSSASFVQENESKIGFVVSLKEIKLLKQSSALDMMVCLTIESRMDYLLEISFKVIYQEEIFSTGTIILKISE